MTQNSNPFGAAAQYWTDAWQRGVSRSANQIPPVLLRSAPDIARQSQSAKFRFPDPRDREAGAEASRLPN